jgi:hypothetical protein
MNFLKQVYGHMKERHLQTILDSYSDKDELRKCGEYYAVISCPICNEKMGTECSDIPFFSSRIYLCTHHEKCGRKMDREKALKLFNSLPRHSASLGTRAEMKNFSRNFAHKNKLNFL